MRRGGPIAKRFDEGFAKPAAAGPLLARGAVAGP